MTLVKVSKIIVLDTVEGFTERLLISSTGHMILVDEITRLNQPGAFKDVFPAVIQLEVILAVVVMYFHRLNPSNPIKSNRQKDAAWALWIKIMIAYVSTVALGFLLDDWMEVHLFNAHVVTATLIIYGVLFIVLENGSVCSNPQINKVGQISAKAAFMIGMIQLLALTSEIFRPGSITLGAIVLGCPRDAVAEFSFFLGIPVMFGASLLEPVKHFATGNAFTGPQIFHMVLGMLIAFVVSVHSIQPLMSYVRKHDFKLSGYYRIILGVIVLVYFGITTLAS